MTNPHPFTDPPITVAPPTGPTGATPAAPHTPPVAPAPPAPRAAETGKQAASDVAQTATDKAKEVAAEGKRQARNLLGEAQQQMKHQAANSQRTLAGNVRSLADQLNSMADGSTESGVATDLVGQAAQQAHGVASWLDDREPGDLLDELRRFARNRPGVFLLGALAAGVVAGRLTRGVVAAHSNDGPDGSAAPYPATGDQL